jgi:NAD(P)-dependent dehydrogenase (short-subunit alcohol dehydrogenase family)
MTTRYAAVHALDAVNGPGDARPIAMDIIRDENLTNKLTDKTFLITGVSSGIGIETLRAFHATGAHVFGTVRNLEKGKKVVDEILASNPNGGKIDLVEMELESLDSIRKGAADFLERSGGKLNVFVANAGIMASPEGRTKDGFEKQFGTNYVSHFLLFQLVKDALLASATPEFPSRVISVSSQGHRYSTVRLDDYNFEKEKYEKWAAYGQAKTGNIWLANAINRKYSSKNLYALALHPGMIYTGLLEFLSEEDLKPFEDPRVQKKFKNQGQGASTTVLAALGADWRKVGGVWVSDCQVQGAWDGEFFNNEGYASHAFDEEGEEKLWKMSLEMVGLKAE